MAMTPRERVLAAMKREKVDRTPVAVFTQSATIGQMEKLGVFWPDAHSNPKAMAKLGAGQADVLGFEAVRAPFCLTAEAESLGCVVDPGKQDRTPMLKSHPFKFDPMDGVFDEPKVMDVQKFLNTGRAKAVQEGIKLLKEQKGKEYVVIAGNTGPFTLAGHMVSTENLVFGIMMAPEEVTKWMKAITPICKGYTQALADAGADVIQMSEPSSSTDLLSPDMFDEYSGCYVKDSLASVKGAESVLHICGNTTDLLPNMINCKVTGLSIEEKVDPVEGIKIVRKLSKKVFVVGNVGVVHPLLQGTPAECQKHGEIVKAAGFDVVSPGCGLSALIKNENLLGLVKGVKG
jgi:[methyl-Co(III) methanol-specific corrinoid protein]:coenzyme M methyltransferase